jgi:hypothetical protein
MVRNESSQISEVLKQLGSFQKPLIYSYSVFIRENIFDLNKILAKTFLFCSEQFIQECFLIREARQTDKKVKFSLSVNPVHPIISVRMSPQRSYSKDKGEINISKITSHFVISSDISKLIISLIPSWLIHVNPNVDDSSFLLKC